MLKEKSKLSIAAAELLQDQEYYPSSVHCSYFSCFQLLKFSLSDFFGLSEADFSAIEREAKQKAKDLGREWREGSHQFLINYVIKEIEKNYNSDISGDISDRINLLKKYRVESDYMAIPIDINKSKKAYYMAKQIHEDLKEILHV